MLQAYQITLSEPRTGPRGGKAKPVIRMYTVTAESNKEALEIFKEEMPAHIDENTHVSVSGCGCRVMRCC
jgi:hypothetical protein